MTARTESLLALGLMILLSLVFQIQLKMLANAVAPILGRTDIESAARLTLVAREFVSLRFVVIVMIALVLFLLWFFALTKTDLSVALPIVSLALVLNAVGGGLILGEPLTWARIGGIAAVAIGVFLVIKS